MSLTERPVCVSPLNSGHSEESRRGHQCGFIHSEFRDSSPCPEFNGLTQTGRSVSDIGSAKTHCV
jgi:hypothetical protein